MKLHFPIRNKRQGMQKEKRKKKKKEKNPESDTDGLG
jgi:hypothetical protein